MPNHPVVAQSVLICIAHGPTARQLEASIDAAGGTYVSLTSFDEVLQKQDRFHFDAIFVAWPDDLLAALRGTLSGHGEDPPLFVAICGDASGVQDALLAGADDVLLAPLSPDQVRVRLEVLGRRTAARRHRRADVDALEARVASAQSLLDALPDHAWQHTEQGLESLRDTDDLTLGRAILDAGHHYFSLIREDGQRRQFAVESTDAQGAVAHFDVRIALEGDHVVVLAREVAEAAGTQRALARAHGDFRQLIESAPHGVLLHDNNTIVYVNRKTADIIGVDPDDLLGRDATSLLHPDDRGHALARVREFVATQIPPEPREYRALRSTGEVAIVEVTPGAIVEFEGKRVALLLIRDLTETRRMMAKLAMASRMASLGTLAAGVAHELNNPLSFVITNLCVLREELEAVAELLPESTTTEVTGILRDLDSGAVRIRDIVRDLSAWTQIDGTVNGAVDLQETVAHSLRLLGSELVAVRVERDMRATPLVVAARGRLAQVVTNLVLNAVHALRDVEPQRRVVSIRTHMPTADAVLLEVSDKGPGMEEAVAARVFEPFFTTKPAGSGSGLGLWVCHSLLMQMGGSIDVVSVPGQGTTFTVSLQPDTPGRGIGPFLVADDEPALARALARLLPGPTTVVHSGAALLDRVGEQKWVAVLCDYSMPEMSGVDVYERLAATAPDAAERFVLLVPEQHREAAADAPVRKITKPFDKARLDELLAELDAAE